MAKLEEWDYKIAGKSALIHMNYEFVLITAKCIFVRFFILSFLGKRVIGNWFSAPTFLGVEEGNPGLKTLLCVIRA